MEFKIDKFKTVVPKFIQEIQQNVSDLDNLPNFQNRENQISTEIKNLISILNLYPKGKSYSLDEIMVSLEVKTFPILSLSNFILKIALSVLQDNNLLRGIFIMDLGILDLITQRNHKQHSVKYIDDKACFGIRSVDKPSIFYNYVYKNTNCPFCKEAIRIEDIQTSIIMETLKSGITFTSLERGAIVAFHSKY